MILMIRSIVTLTVSFGIMWTQKEGEVNAVLWKEVKFDELGLIVVRSVLSFIALATSYESLRGLSLGLYSAIHVAQPLISYTIGYCMLDRSIHLTEVANLNLSILAIYLIAKDEYP